MWKELGIHICGYYRLDDSRDKLRVSAILFKPAEGRQSVSERGTCDKGKTKPKSSHELSLREAVIAAPDGELTRD